MGGVISFIERPEETGVLPGREGVVEDPLEKKQGDSGTGVDEKLIAAAKNLLAEEGGTSTQSNQ